MPDASADPPAVEREPELARRLHDAYAAKGDAYTPRTHLRTAEGRAKYVNRLIGEPSPYLLQHAHNPVDWHPWGPETLEKAARLDRPVFLSVGYATCHWCHVMEEESFDDEEVAAVMNADFIPVKIDREQRPDLDHIYITATQLQHGHAGWPNSVFLMPDGRPFHTGTYFPKAQFLQVLRAVAEAWKSEQRGEIERVAGKLSEAISQLGPTAEPAAPPPGEAARQALLDQLAKMHNADEGGFSTQQQFPQEGFLLWLLDHWRRTGSDAALGIAARTLDAIAAGGIHDHAGGGFHRYTVDPNWRTPHFEKMLYNQALLSRAFLEGWQITGRAAWARAARRAFAYVARDMTDPDGAFYAAEDADSPDAAGRREEGAFYAWTPEQVRAALGEDADGAVRLLGLDKAPTIEAGAVPHLEPGAEPDFAALDPLLERLRRAREARPRPIRDDKVIAGWNGLMIRALAEGAAVLDEPSHAEAAARAGDALWQRLWDGERLCRLWADGRALEDGMLEDHAWLGLGFLALFDATGDARWRERAEALARRMLAIFGHGSGRLKMAAADGPTGPIFDSADGAVPSGESSALELLARLGVRSGDPAFRAAAERLLGAISGALTQMPLLRPDAMTAAAILSEGESGHLRSLAGGAVRAVLAPGGDSLRLRIAEGWHLNAHAPGPDFLIGAAVEGAEADWPAGDERRFGFADAPVRVYAGELTVPLRPAAPLIALSIQACSESACLAPERAEFRLR